MRKCLFLVCMLWIKVCSVLEDVEDNMGSDNAVFSINKEDLEDVAIITGRCGST